MKTGRRVTETGGRDATTRHIPPKHALAVGLPSSVPPRGWRWSLLTDLARLESGHTPSRRHPEYWGGAVPWLSIPDAREHDGGQITDTEEHTNASGIEHSSARVLPKNTVCLSRTASVGYVVVMARPMATSQDFVNWVCGNALDHNFLKYLLVAEGDDLLRFASGSVHQTIYFPEVKAFHVCHPPLAEQRRIVGLLDEALAGIAAAVSTAERNAQNARAVFESYRESVIHHQGWELKTLGDLCERVEYGTSAKSKPTGRMPVLRMGNIQNERLDWTDLVYTDDDAEIAKYRLKKCDVLFNRTNSVELVGKSAIYLGERPALFAGYLIRIHRREGLVDAGYLNYFLNSAATREYGRSVMISSVSQANISGTKLLTYLMPTPPLSEQRAIVKKLDALREETERLSGLYESKISALAALKQSLLHHAFTGQL